MDRVRQIVFFYRDGFKQMHVGKQLWAIIAIKFFLFFVVLKLFFSPNILQTHFSNDTQRADSVMEHLMQK